MIKLDLHIHSKYSYDSISDPKIIVKVAKMRGLSGIAITDHNTIKGGLEAKKYSDENLIVIVGSEITTKEGEVIGLFLEKEIPANLNIIETIEKIHKQNGLAILPHPFDTHRKHAVQNIDKKILNVIDGIEVLNARSKAGINANAQKFANENKLKITAGSDAHTLLEIGSAGMYIEGMEKVTEEEIMKLLLINNRLKIYLKPIPRLIYRPFDIIGKNLKKRKITNKYLFYLLNKIQEVII